MRRPTTSEAPVGPGLVVANRPPPLGGAAPPEPPSTGRSRSRALAGGIVSALAGKMVGLAAPLLITPLAFRSLGAERYGLWMAVTSLTGMALFADFGLGNGLLTRLARLRGTGERPAAAREISSAYALLGALSVLLMVVLVATLRWVPWPALLNAVDPTVARDARPVVLLCFGAFLVNIPLALIQRVQYAHQQVAQSNLWQAGGSLVSVALVYAAVTTGAGHVLVVAAAVLAVPVVNLANSVCYFAWQDRELRPRARHVRAAVARSLLRLGARFFLLSVLCSVVLNLDGFLISRVLGLPAAATYAVVLRMFALLTLFVTLVNLPFWPANGEALARGTWPGCGGSLSGWWACRPASSPCPASLSCWSATTCCVSGYARPTSRRCLPCSSRGSPPGRCCWPWRPRCSWCRTASACSDPSSSAGRAACCWPYP